MALKISVTLPNGVVIAVEADESHTYDSLTGIALRELPSRLSTPQGVSASSAVQQVQQAMTASPEISTPVTSSQGQKSAEPPTMAPEEKIEDWERFRTFCKQTNPLGDMRRVVVAAEGARLHLNMKSVSTKELASLFESLGWTRPRNLVQTLRNSARSIFRWMERVPGRRGFYTVTDKGREIVLGEDYSPE
jgi:hypothetical protein